MSLQKPTTDVIERWLTRRRLKRRAKPVAGPPEIPEDVRHSLEKIQHIVVLMMENHSYDNYLGSLDRGDGFTRQSGTPTHSNDAKNGVPVQARHRPTTYQPKGLPLQTWRASRKQFNGGANDGFCRSIQDFDETADPQVAMDYFTESDLPFYYWLARTFPLFDRWFCSCLGPTFPNRRFLLAGTAYGLIDDTLYRPVDYPPGGTILDYFTANGISWTNYHDVSSAWAVLKRLVGKIGLNVFRLVGLLIPFLRDYVAGNLQFTTALYPMGLLRASKHLKPLDQFFEDATAGTLPQFSIVDPSFGDFSEENPQDIRFGQGFAYEVIKAVVEGKAWDHTVLFWLYDEHGGYYDHVRPPEAPEPDEHIGRSLLDSGGLIKWLVAITHLRSRLERIDRVQPAEYHFDHYGFRVPAVVVSPFAKRKWVASEHISDVYFDHTSILKLVEMRWQLPMMTHRDEAAVAPLAALDLTSPEPPFLEVDLPKLKHPWPSNRHVRKERARQQRREARQRLRGRRGGTRAGVPW